MELRKECISIRTFTFESVSVKNCLLWPTVAKVCQMLVTSMVLVHKLYILLCYLPARGISCPSSSSSPISVVRFLQMIPIGSLSWNYLFAGHGYFGSSDVVFIRWRGKESERLSVRKVLAYGRSVGDKGKYLY